MIRESAPAKINLFLHILGRRSDGYHDIESAAVFADLADQLEVEELDTLSLTTSGAFAQAAGDTSQNLVLKAAQLLQTKAHITRGAKFHLVKEIPVGAGLGGGSADAAAALRALNRFWHLGWSEEQLQHIAPEIGADVAMCIASKPVLARGIGAELHPLPWHMPTLNAVLVHPRMPLLTAEVYAAFRTLPLKAHPLTKMSSLQKRTFSEVIEELSQCSNDLEAPAMMVNPALGDVMRALRDTSPALARMTGSGACCFGLYETAEQAALAARAISARYSPWFVKAVTLR